MLFPWRKKKENFKTQTNSHNNLGELIFTNGMDLEHKIFLVHITDGGTANKSRDIEPLGFLVLACMT